MHLLGLPQETLDSIVSYLEWEDVTALRQCSKECYGLLDSARTWKSIYHQYFDWPSRRYPDWRAELKRRSQLLTGLSRMKTMGLLRPELVDWNLLLEMHNENRGTNYVVLESLLRIWFPVSPWGNPNRNICRRLTMLHTNVRAADLLPPTMTMWNLLHTDSWPGDSQAHVFEDTQVSWERVHSIVYHHRSCVDRNVPRKWFVENWNNGTHRDWGSLISGTWYGTFGRSRTTVLPSQYKMIGCMCDPMPTTFWQMTLGSAVKKGDDPNTRWFRGSLSTLHGKPCNLHAFASVHVKVSLDPEVGCLHWKIKISFRQGQEQDLSDDSDSGTKHAWASGVSPIIGRVVVAGTRDPFPRETKAGRFHSFAFWPMEQCFLPPLSNRALFFD